MKTIKIKMIAGCILLVFFALTSYSQEEDERNATTIERDNVPQEVMDNYNMEYPEITDENWYGYPNYDYGNDWYNDWYNDGPYSYVEYPAYYVTKFYVDKIPYTIVYSKDGKKVATHIMLYNLPKAVSDAISKGEYKTWKLGDSKEEIFQDKNADLMKVYKVTVEKGNQKHALYFQSNGNLLKNKKLS